MSATPADPAVTRVALDALTLGGVASMPRSIRLDAAMLRLLIAVPPGNPDAAARALGKLRPELVLVLSQARMPTPRGAVHASDEQAVILYLQEAAGLSLGVDASQWRSPREQDRREFITELGRSLFFQLGGCV